MDEIMSNRQHGSNKMPPALGCGGMMRGVAVLCSMLAFGGCGGIQLPPGGEEAALAKYKYQAHIDAMAAAQQKRVDTIVAQHDEDYALRGKTIAELKDEIARLKAMNVNLQKDLDDASAKLGEANHKAQKAERDKATCDHRLAVATQKKNCEAVGCN